MLSWCTRVPVCIPGLQGTIILHAESKNIIQTLLQVLWQDEESNEDNIFRGVGGMVYKLKQVKWWRWELERMWCINTLSKHLMMVDARATVQKSLRHVMVILLGNIYYCNWFIITWSSCNVLKVPVSTSANWSTHSLISRPGPGMLSGPAAFHALTLVRPLSTTVVLSAY